MNENISLKINDIKDIVKIPDNSIFIYFSLVFIAFIIVISIIVYIIKYFKNKKINKRKTYFNILKDIEFKEPKRDAYTITKYLRLLVREDREKRLANELINDLEAYKYKKEVSDIDTNIKNKLTTLLDILDVK
ncbi:hypothetical protein KO488_15090 [Poseidonibacter lekithochrous]|uniref:hypothetical protein n=1 Tax=Poseidonibacter TaxID=2321187 RepID=UPI001C09D40F|nr:MULTISPECIES: hypothetical protein [Poseidonibacter]MBU3016081.1 hypothetical protein [Poseidonibacter lekithochrous]MDO6829380.1 hypothetical protein [Poseidonibacter sp. 1_MG-2023]